MDTNSSLRQHLILALTSDAGDLDQPLHSGPKPRATLCFQTSFLRTVEYYWMVPGCPIQKDSSRSLRMDAEKRQLTFPLPG